MVRVVVFALCCIMKAGVTVDEKFLEEGWVNGIEDYKEPRNLDSC